MRSLALDLRSVIGIELAIVLHVQWCYCAYACGPILCMKYNYDARAPVLANCAALQ